MDTKDPTTTESSRDDDEPRVERIADLMGELWTLLETRESLGDVLQELVEIAQRTFPPGYEASITILARDDQPETVAITEPQLLELDKAQYDAGEGPCLDAANQREPVRTNLDGARDRWPHFAEVAEAAGVFGYLSAPILTDHTAIGSFNLYSKKPDRFDAIDAALLTLFTNSALAAVANAQHHHRARKVADQLRHALESRALIDHAIGVLIERHGLTAEQAWTRLQRESQDRNVKVRDLAAQLTGTPPLPPLHS